MTTGLPLVIAAPLFGLFMNMQPLGIAATMATLLVGTPAITFVGAVGAAVTVTLPRGGLLLAVLVLPWTIPILIFGVSAAYGAVEDPAPFMPPFVILCAISLFYAVIGALGAGAVLRHSSH
jgi:heme exporter protein B